MSSLGIIASYSSSLTGPFHLSRRTEADCLHLPNHSQAIFDSVESGLVVLISQCTHSDGNETLQHKLRVGGEKKMKQWVFERGSFVNLQKQEESDVPSVSAQSALVVYDLSMILNGCDIFSLHISSFFGDGSENPLQSDESYFAAVQFNGNPVSFPWATARSAQAIRLPFANQNNFLYALGKSTVSSSMYSKIHLETKMPYPKLCMHKYQSLLQYYHLFFHIQALQLPEAH